MGERGPGPNSEEIGVERTENLSEGELVAKWRDIMKVIEATGFADQYKETLLREKAAELAEYFNWLCVKDPQIITKAREGQLTPEDLQNFDFHVYHHMEADTRFIPHASELNIHMRRLQRIHIQQMNEAGYMRDRYVQGEDIPQPGVLVEGNPAFRKGVNNPNRDGTLYEIEPGNAGYTKDGVQVKVGIGTLYTYKENFEESFVQRLHPDDPVMVEEP